MENTYTFSRALHMMRYGGAKMRSLKWPRGSELDYVFVQNGDLMFSDGTYVEEVTYKMCLFPSLEIMGSWVEVQG